MKTGDLMSDCCISKAASEVGRIRVKGTEVGISNLDGILQSVTGLEGDELREELIKQASVFNYIPKERREDYCEGLLQALEDWRGSR